jgi:hypothetical protein
VELYPAIFSFQIEWDLVLKYVANYPVILSNMNKCVNDSSMMIKFSSNKVSRYQVVSQSDRGNHYRVGGFICDKNHVTLHKL